MLLAAVVLLWAPDFGDEPMESLLKGLRSDDADVRSKATTGILAGWRDWKDADLLKLEEASLDRDPEVGSRAAEARARIRIRRTIGPNLVEKVAGVDEAFLRGDDEAKLAVLQEAKRVWKTGTLTREDLAGLESLATRAQWRDPGA